MSDPEDPKAEVEKAISRLVHLALVQFGDMQEVTDELKEVGERLSKITPHRVLLIDDDPQITHGLERLLTARGHVVREVNDSADALGAARDFQPDVVILDFLMPHLHGGEVAWQLASDKALDHTPRVVLCTAALPDQYRQKLPPMKIDVMEKPVDADRLLGLIG